MWSSLARKIGIEHNQTSHLERLIAGCSTCLAITLVALFTQWSLSDETHLLFFASTAASAFLVFTLPHGPLSQPWPVLAGQTLAMLVGIVAGWYLGSSIISAAMAVGATILLMHYLRCLHPPGAATTFFFVTGMDHIPLQETCLAFMINIAIIIALAILINNAFQWRRYPVAWFNHTQQFNAKQGDSITIENLHQALKHHDAFIDISLEELQTLYSEAQKARLK